MIRKDPHHGVALFEGSLDLPLDLRLPSNWIEFGIWGLMVFDSQPPWFTLIECMHIFFHRHRHSQSLFAPPDAQRGALKHEYIKYEVLKNWNLRYLLFCDLEIDRIAQNGKPDKSAQWSELIRRVRDADKSIDLSYLSRSFEDVESLHEALKLLRSTEVEAYSSKGWTQRQILPLGPDMLLADIKDRSHNSADRLFLRRTGELLYLMLGRSSASQHGSLQQLIRDRMLVRDHACNKLARLIGQGVQTTDSGLDSTARAATGYLPFVKLDAYDRLAEDWGALLSLSRMPIEDILDPLMRLSTFHLIIYLLSVAESVHDKGRSEYPPFVFDLAGRPRKNPMQRSARGQYGNHLSLPRRALEHFVDTFCSSEYWAASAGTTKGAKRAREIITELFRVNEEGSSPEEMLNNLRQSVVTKRSHSIRSAIIAHARQTGMILARPGVGTWYSPNDAFLAALVLANVTTPVELGEFLRRLFQRYRIVIGQEQAQKAFEGDVLSLGKLKHNERHLEERLRVLDLIDRKSDACAFVVNPFWSSKDDNNS